MKQFFTKTLLQWHKTDNKRIMPWKGEKNPYKIWLSEIILQQTKVEQGLKYYEKFISKFPDILKLAKANEETVFKMWEGLGYYNRCKNLLETAKKIAQNKGMFPETYAEILELKGVGVYTASAIASFAYNLPYAVVDGNVHRVLSRYFALDIPVDSNDGKKQFEQLAFDLLNKKEPGIYNQAIMDFGATICKPKQALCQLCVLSKKCKANRSGAIYAYPVKEKKISIKKRQLIYFIFHCDQKVAVTKRVEEDVWKNLFEFYLEEQQLPLIPDVENSKDLVSRIVQQPFTIDFISTVYVQKLTHQIIHANFVRVTLKKQIKWKGYQWVNAGELNNIPFPAIINDFLRNDKFHFIFDK